MTNEPIIVRRKVEALIPYARNSRTHDDAQVAQIAASVREFGWTNRRAIADFQKTKNFQMGSFGIRY